MRLQIGFNQCMQSIFFLDSHTGCRLCATLEFRVLKTKKTVKNEEKKDDVTLETNERMAILTLYQTGYRIRSQT